MMIRDYFCRVYHCENKPAHIKWYPNGTKKYEKWYINGLLHNLKNPAVTKWYPNGTKRYKAWYQYGVLMDVLFY